MKKHILFLCSQNKLRSPTAEAVFTGHPAVDVDSAGLNNDAEVPLSEEQVEWADLSCGEVLWLWNKSLSADLFRACQHAIPLNDRFQEEIHLMDHPS